MKATRAPAAFLAVIAALFTSSAASADELDAGFSDAAPPPFRAPAVPEGLYLVTDVYAGNVVASSGDTTTYTTATVRDIPGTYARVLDVVGSGALSEFDDRSFNGRARLSDGRPIAGTYYEDFVLTAAGFVSVNIVFFQDDSETRDAARPSPVATARTIARAATPTPSRAPASTAAPSSPASPVAIASTRPTQEPSPAPRPTPDSSPAPRVPVANAGVALAPDGPVLASLEVLRGRTIVLWPRVFADGIAVPLRSWRLVSGGGDVVAPGSGSSVDGCQMIWLAIPPDGAVSIVRFEMTSDALPGRVLSAAVSVTVRSPALLQ